MSSKNTPIEVTATTPDFALKKKLDDVNIRDAFTADVIASADSVIEESKQDFFGGAADDLDAMETAYAAAKSDAEKSKIPVKSIERTAHSLKGQAETLGFDLLAHVSKSLDDFCIKVFRAGDTEQLIVLRKHLDALQLIVREKMQGDGGALGKELISSLNALTKKYA